MGNLKESALEYARAGLHVVPCGARTKVPVIAWRQYQEKAPALEQVEAWWTQWPDANIAIVMGRGVFALDFDGEGAEELLTSAGFVIPDSAPCVRTAKGVHVYLSSGGKSIRNKGRWLGDPKVGIDVRGDGGYVMAPPSLHDVTGQEYEWLVPLEGMPPLASSDLIAALSEGEAPLLSAPRSQSAASLRQAPASAPGRPKWIAEALRGVGEGMRDATCTRLAGYFFKRGLSFDIVLQLLLDWGRRCDPPFAEYAVRKCLLSIARHHPQAEEDPDESEPLAVPLADVSVAMAAEHEYPAPTLATPFPLLNEFLHGGFRPGELIYLGARPGVGKTVFALECVRYAAQHDVRCLYVTREMLAIQLCERLFAQNARITSREMRYDRGPHYLDALAEVGALPVWISERAGSLGDIAQACAEVEPGFVCIDYMQLLAGPERDTRERVDAISRGLKRLAIQRRIPILCLSSVSRSAQGDDKPPTMSRLRESGNLEHDGDIVIMMHRPKGADVAIASVEKARQGETGQANLRFDGRFTSLLAMD